ncbi:MAG: hypothetical protein KBD21_01395 [Candidatus Pacebacteria bacterium]|nr:hypothetical protein [Candidatus Paceibacterota bacterium]
MHELASKHGGKCLSVTYINARTKLKWQCSVGHIWETVPDVIRRGSWCQKCAGKRTGDSKKWSIGQIQEIAKSRGGLCLSTKYVNSKTKLKWKCAKGHAWEATPEKVCMGRWCQKCSGKRNGDLRRFNIIQMQELATKFGGKCISENYVSAVSKLKWQCSEHHEWEATPNSVQQLHWCPRCAWSKIGDLTRLNIEEMQKLAAKRAGLCLSTKYINNGISLKWRCAEGHEWVASPSSIKMGTWCPECGLQNVTENICREIFERIFSKKFPKVKPKWLVNDDGNKMEFDGYNEKLRLAFEYHGEQYYKYNPFFYRNNKEKFIKRKIDDRTKHCLSKEKGVCLVEIPFTVDVLDLYKHIIAQCENLGVHIPKHDKIEVSEIQSTYRAKNLLDLRKVAEEHGGKLISKIYLGTQSNHVWECSMGHKWKASPHNIKRGRWCPKCAIEIRGDATRLDIEQMYELAKKHGGKCLSTKYINAGTKLKWQCANGHIWESTPNKIQQGRWCAKCSRRYPLDMMEMQEIATKRGGRCLSTKYINARTRLRWQCSQGHEWEAVPDSVKRGTWCPMCVRKNNRKIAIFNVKERL